MIPLALSELISTEQPSIIIGMVLIPITDWPAISPTSRARKISEFADCHFTSKMCYIIMVIPKHGHCLLFFPLIRHDGIFNCAVDLTARDGGMS
jgi:hypothetical protein